MYTIIKTPKVRDLFYICSKYNFNLVSKTNNVIDIDTTRHGVMV